MDFSHSLTRESNGSGSAKCAMSNCDLFHSLLLSTLPFERQGGEVKQARSVAFGLLVDYMLTLSRIVSFTIVSSTNASTTTTTTKAPGMSRTDDRSFVHHYLVVWALAERARARARKKDLMHSFVSFLVCLWFALWLIMERLFMSCMTSNDFTHTRTFFYHHLLLLQ